MLTSGFPIYASALAHTCIQYVVLCVCVLACMCIHLYLNYKEIQSITTKVTYQVINISQQRKA